MSPPGSLPSSLHPHMQTITASTSTTMPPAHKHSLCAEEPGTQATLPNKTEFTRRRFSSEHRGTARFSGWYFLTDATRIFTDELQSQFFTQLNPHMFSHS